MKNFVLLWLDVNIIIGVFIFTDLALWAGSVIESPCPSVCVSVCHKSCNSRLWPKNQILKKNRAIEYGSQNSKSLRTSKLHDVFKSNNKFINNYCSWLLRDFFISRTSLLRTIRESAGEGLWLLALITGRTLKVTCEMWHVTCDLWHMSHTFCLNKKARRVAKSVKMFFLSTQKCKKKCQNWGIS